MPTLRGLQPWWRPMAERFVRRWAGTGLRVTSARRTYQEQARLYADSQRGANGGLPAVRPGTSDHEYGLAFDMARPGIDPRSDELLMAAGLEWQRQGGRWGGQRDPVHFAAPVGRQARRSRRRRRA